MADQVEPADESWLAAHEGYGSERLRAEMLHQLPNVVPLFIGPNHVVSGINPAAVQFFNGFNPIGLAIAEVFAGAEGQGILELYDRVFAGETVRAERMRFAVATPNGAEVESFLDFTLVPFRDRDDRIVGTLGSAVDVTDRVLRERSDAAAAQELDRRYQRATDVIEEVQRALLPSRLPALAGVDVAASYVVGGAEQAAGGDWFDVLSRPDGTVVAIVGDVVGHGVGASAVMSQLRAVTLERLHAGATPADAVAALDRFVEIVPAGRGATICVLALDPLSGRFEWCAAAHPPPLIVDPRGDSRYLDPSGEPPLGEIAGRTSRTGVLGSEQVLLLYTDGILERPGVPVTAGTVELRQIATDAVADRLYPGFTLPAAVDRCTRHTLERLTRETGSTDDVTLLALQRVPPTEALHLAVELTPPAVAGVRDAVHRWFRLDQCDSDALAQLDQIITEICENSIEHGYRGAGGPARIDATLSPQGTMTLTIADDGAWRPPPHPNAGRGLGLAIARDLADHLRVEGTATGTTVTVELHPWKRSQGTVPRSARRPNGVSEVFVNQTADRTIVTATGALDAATVGELTGALAISTTPGSAPVVVDLDEVTALSSTAIHAIARTRADAQAAGVEVTITCRPGSAAHHALALADIPTHRPD